MAAVTGTTAEGLRGSLDSGSIRKVARGGAVNLLGAASSAVATLGFTILVTRTLDTASAGTFFALTSMFVIAAALTRLAVPSALVYFIARFSTTGRHGDVSRLITYAVQAVSVMSVVIGVAGFVLAEEVAALVTESAGQDEVALVQLLSACLLFAALTDVAVGATRGLGSMRPAVVVDKVLRPLAQIVLVAVLAASATTSVYTVGLAWALPYLPAAAALFLWVRVQARRQGALDMTAPRSWRRDDRRALWSFTMPRSVGSVAQVLLQRLDIILVGMLLGPRDAALYAAATRFLVVGQMAAQAIGLAMQPTVARLMVLHDRAGSQQVYSVATVWLILATWPVYLTTIAYAPDALAVFGREYVTAASVVVVLCSAMLVATSCGAVDVVLTMSGRAALTMYNALAALGLNIALNLVLIPRVGIIGAAIAWAAAILVNNVVPLAQVAALLRLTPFSRAGAAAGLLSIGSFLVLPLTARALAGGSVAAALAATGLGTLAFAAAGWRWRSFLELATLHRALRAKAAPPPAVGEAPVTGGLR